MSSVSPHSTDPSDRQEPAFAEAAPSAASPKADRLNWERDALAQLLQAWLLEKRSARRWTLFWRMLMGFVVLGLCWMIWAQGAGVPAASSAPHTAMVAIRGEISAESDASASHVMESLRLAFADDGAQAVVLVFDSPGGSPVQAGLINDEIHRLKKLHKKPVYAVVEDSCASAAYYIAVAADAIYVNKASLVGSIGVLMDGFGFSGLMDKLGVERRLLTAGENKGFLDPYSPQSADHKVHAQRMLQQIHDQFIAAVKQGRGNKLKETPEIFSGLFWSGEQALELGLADELGSLDQVARDVVQAEDVIDYTHQESVTERLTRQLGAAIGKSSVTVLMKSTNRLH